MAPKTFGAVAHLITVSNCKVKTTQKLFMDKLMSILPPFQSLSVCKEKHKKGDVHFHIFGHWRRKWTFTKATWAPVRKLVNAANDDFKTWNSKMGITARAWRVEKWRYCNNLVTAGFTDSKGDDKGQIWVENRGEEYVSETSAENSELSSNACILRDFAEKKRTLVAQYENADWTLKAHMALHWDKLSKMIGTHRRIQRITRTHKRKYTKSHFHCIEEAEKHDFTKQVLLLMGPPGWGKTNYSKTFFTNPLSMRVKCKLKVFDPNHHDGIIIDDMDFREWTREDFLALIEVEEETDIYVKHSHVTLEAGVPRILLTNRNLYDFLPKDLIVGKTEIEDVAVFRRMNIITVSSDLRRLKSRVE